MNNEAAEVGRDGAEVKKCTNPDAQKLAATTEEPAPRGEVHQDGSGEQAGNQGRVPQSPIAVSQSRIREILYLNF